MLEPQGQLGKMEQQVHLGQPAHLELMGWLDKLVLLVSLVPLETLDQLDKMDKMD
jgi:hypothetical protein